MGHHQGVPEGEKREKGTERLFEEIMAENCPNLMKVIQKTKQQQQRKNNELQDKLRDPHQHT